MAIKISETLKTVNKDITAKVLVLCQQKINITTDQNRYKYKFLKKYKAREGKKNKLLLKLNSKQI